MSKKRRTALFSIHDLTLCALMVALMSICAHIAIPLPFFPVPFTMQNMIVLLCGLLLPLRAAMLTMGTYTFLGLCGLPVFSSGGGFAYVLLPTFGYIIGFFAASAFLSICQPYYRNAIWKKIVFCLIATLLIHLCGSLYFLLIATYVQHLPNPFATVTSMLMTFLPMDLIKAGLCVLVIIPIEKQVHSFLHIQK